MRELVIGDILRIQCYKHNGDIHRDWNKSKVLEINDDSIVCYNNRVRVTESDGRKWNTREPALLFFYKDSWFNIIVQLKEEGIYYYCNIATPYIIENNVIKYIDYDLDLRVFPDGEYKVLDEDEYDYHKQIMGYSNELDKIINFELNDLIEMYKKREGPFSKEYLKKYMNMIKQCRFYLYF